ncbi:MAG: hypothetical protein E6356_13740 [Terrisporobacter othiniensis]|nr:hypothetical protein [Terrisporobacter othiniensis]
MKVFIKEDICDYVDFNDSEGKIYDCKSEEIEDVIYIIINDNRVEYDEIQDCVLLFEDDVELAHYLIDNNKGLATNIVEIYKTLK